MRYAIVIEKAKKNYAAYVPDLPGCIATARTVEETKKQIQKAIIFHLEGMVEDGLPIPKPTSLVEYVVTANGNGTTALANSVISKSSPRISRRSLRKRLAVSR